MLTAETVRQTLARAELGEAMAEALGDYPGLTPGELHRLIDEFAGHESRFLADVAEVEEHEVLLELAIAFYIEAKCRFIRTIAEANYQLWRTGQSSPWSACRSAAASILVASVEPLIDRETVERITRFLADPLADVA